MATAAHGSHGTGLDGPPQAPGLVMVSGLADSSTASHPVTTVAGLEANTFADGFFHLATWLLVAVGAGMLVQAWRTGQLAPPWRAHIGMLRGLGDLQRG